MAASSAPTAFSRILAVLLGCLGTVLVWKALRAFGFEYLTLGWLVVVSALTCASVSAERRSAEGQRATCRRRRAWRAPVLAGAAWLIFDRIYFMGFFGYMLMLFQALLLPLVPLLLAGLVAAQTRASAPRTRTHWGTALAFTMFLDTGMSALDNLCDRAGARGVIAGVERYHARTGRYPASLEELVPYDLPALSGPRPFAPRIAFEYIAPEPAHEAEPARPPLLLWTRFVFYRITYRFGEKRWGSLD